MTDPGADPWEGLRSRSRTADSRGDARVGRLLTPEASERLYVATAAVLASVRHLVEVAEEIVAEKIDSFPAPERHGPARPSAAEEARFADIVFTDLGGNGG